MNQSVICRYVCYKRDTNEMGREMLTVKAFTPLVAGPLVALRVDARGRRSDRDGRRNGYPTS